MKNSNLKEFLYVYIGILSLVLVIFIISIRTNEKSKSTNISKISMTNMSNVISEADIKLESKILIDELYTPLNTDSINLKGVYLEKDFEIIFKSFTKNKNWYNNSYGSDYGDGTQMYNYANKKESILQSDIIVKSDSLKIFLPELCVYYYENNKFYFIGLFIYRFKYWQTHATSIGLEHDSKNSLRDNNLLKMTIGAYVDNKYNSKKLYIIANLNKRWTVGGISKDFIGYQRGVNELQNYYPNHLDVTSEKDSIVLNNKLDIINFYNNYKIINIITVK